MGSFLQQVNLLDRAVVEATEALRWGPLTGFFIVLSAWWVKGPLLVAVGALGDVDRRRRLPVVAVFAGASGLIAEILAAILKPAFDRERPAAAGANVDAVVATPDSASFPSGHAAAAFAAATLISTFHPRLRIPAFAVATLVALSRVYLGVHFGLDVLAGAVLGIGVGLAATWCARRMLVRVRARRWERLRSSRPVTNRPRAGSYGSERARGSAQDEDGAVRVDHRAGRRAA